MSINDLVQGLRQINVLIVEDGEDIREIMSSTFNKIFKNTYTATDGLEGLKKYEEVKPDIVISDIRMPHMSGNDMIDKIKELDPNIPIIVVSGHGRLIKKTNKADLFLDKPIKFNQLIQEIHRLTR